MSDYAWILAKRKKLIGEQERLDEELKHLFSLEIQRFTGLPCDLGVDQLSDEQLKELLEKARAKKRRRRKQLKDGEIAEEEYYAEQQAEYVEAVQGDMCG